MAQSGIARRELTSPGIVRSRSGVGAQALERLDGHRERPGARVPPGAVPRHLARHVLDGLEELLRLRRREHLPGGGLHGAPPQLVGPARGARHLAHLLGGRLGDAVLGLLARQLHGVGGLVLGHLAVQRGLAGAQAAGRGGERVASVRGEGREQRGQQGQEHAGRAEVPAEPGERGHGERRVVGARHQAGDVAGADGRAGGQAGVALAEAGEVGGDVHGGRVVAVA